MMFFFVVMPIFAVYILLSLFVVRKVFLIKKRLFGFIVLLLLCVFPFFDSIVSNLIFSFGDAICSSDIYKKRNVESYALIGSMCHLYLHGGLEVININGKNVLYLSDSLLNGYRCSFSLEDKLNYLDDVVPDEYSYVSIISEVKIFNAIIIKKEIFDINERAIMGEARSVALLQAYPVFAWISASRDHVEYQCFNDFCNLENVIFLSEN